MIGIYNTITNVVGVLGRFFVGKNVISLYVVGVCNMSMCVDRDTYYWHIQNGCQCYNYICYSHKYYWEYVYVIRVLYII